MLGVLLIYLHSPSGAVHPRNFVYVSVKPLLPCYNILMYMYVCIDIRTFVCMYVCMYACMHVCGYAELPGNELGLHFATGELKYSALICLSVHVCTCMYVCMCVVSL